MKNSSRVAAAATIAFAFALATSSASAASFKWAGGKSPAKKGNTPGQQGDFVLLSEPGDWGQVVYNVQSRFAGARPWVTWAVGPLHEKAAAITDEQRRHADHLKYFDEQGIDVFVEIWPAKGENVPQTIDTWLTKLEGHPSIVGVSVDLEWHRGIDDATAEAWDKAVKAHDPKYRLMLKHWDVAAMPKAYAKKSDVICVNMSSEVDMAGMAAEFAAWANELAPAAVAFQTGYPWDESWWKDLKDPIGDLGTRILAGIESPKQEIGLLWVTVRSPLTAGWDLTRGAKIPASKPADDAKDDTKKK
jgi:hypothetical protein